MRLKTTTQADRVAWLNLYMIDCKKKCQKPQKKQFAEKYGLSKQTWHQCQIGINKALGGDVWQDAYERVFK